MSTEVERPLSFHHFMDFFLFATFPIGKLAGRNKAQVAIPSEFLLLPTLTPIQHPDHLELVPRIG